MVKKIEKSKENRIHNKHKIIFKRLKILKWINRRRYEFFLDKKNFLNKQDPFDCGNPNCQLCHYEKNRNNKNKADRIRTKRQIKDWFDDL
jgi:hypothetical protein